MQDASCARQRGPCPEPLQARISSRMSEILVRVPAVPVPDVPSFVFARRSTSIISGKGLPYRLWFEVECD